MLPERRVPGRALVCRRRDAETPDARHKRQSDTVDGRAKDEWSVDGDGSVPEIDAWTTWHCFLHRIEARSVGLTRTAALEYVKRGIV